MTDSLLYQDADLHPAREGGVFAVILGTTARTYDLGSIDLGSEGDLVTNAQPAGELYLRMICNGDFFYILSSNASATISKTAATADNGAPSMGITMCDFVPANFPEHIRINRKRYRYLTVLADSGSPILRMRPSSSTSGATNKP